MPQRSERPDLLVLSPYLAPPPGGVQRLAEDVANAFADKSVRIVGVSTGTARDDRFRVVRARAGRVGTAFTALHFSAVSFAEIRRQPRVVQAMTWRAALPALLVRRRPPLVLYTHGGELVRGGGLASLLRARVLRAANEIVANSRYTAGLVSHLVGRDATVINPPLRHFSTPSEPIEHHEVTVLAVGRLVRNKGHDRLIRAVHALRGRGIHMDLVIAGGGPEAGALQSLIDGLGVGDAARLVGPVSDADLDELYRSADIFALLSTPVADEVEGFGIVFLEANRYGLPVVAGRSGGSVEAVADGVSGIVVADDAEAADTLERLATDRDLRRRLGVQGQQRLVEFSFDDFRVDLQNVFATVGVPL